MFNDELTEWIKVNLGKGAQISGRYYQLSQLTIVIPTFCRRDYMLRQVVYWSFSNAAIIIVDGSSASLDAQLLDLISNVPNVKYLNLIDSYTNRIKEACRHITTPYSICLADDDIFLMEGLCQAIDYLNQNNDIVACMGQIIGIDYDEKKMNAYVFPYGDSLKNYQVKHKDPAKRIHLGINDYRTATSYAVFRTSSFKDIWGDLQTTSCLEATEYEHAIATYTLGSLSSIPNVYWVRSVECEPVDSLIDGTRKTTFYSWWNLEGYKNERDDFIRRLTIKLSNNSSLNEQDASKEILSVINYILDDRHTGLANKNRLITLLNFIKKTINHFPFLHRCFIEFKSTHLGGVIRNMMIATIRGAANNPVSDVAYDGITDRTSFELNEVLKFISGFHAAKKLKG